MSIYLDYNASAPIDLRVLDEMVDVYKNHPGNSDSRTHDYGESARSIVEDARDKVARLLNVDSSEIFFTSGATESNNIALQGLVEYGKKSGKTQIITTSIEHKAILETAKHLEKEGFTVDFIAPKVDGRVDEEEVLAHVNENTLLVSVMHVNNETGAIQPVDQIGKVLKEKEILFHVDATQSVGKLVKELQQLDYDMLSMSAHKLEGPQGVGALVLRRKNYKLPPVKSIVFGGSQERGIRPGTVPVALVAGFGKAAEIALEEYRQNLSKMKTIKDWILKEVKESGLNYHINGSEDYSIPNTLNISFDGVNSEALMIMSKQYCSISNGSACNSTSYEGSYILKSMNLPEHIIDEAIRISWGSKTNFDQFKKDFESFLDVAKSFVN